MTKRVFCVLSIAVFTNIVALAQPIIKVDERFELISIVFRLNGNPEYNVSNLDVYTSDIDKYFVSYKNHDLIKFLQKNWAKYGLGYNAGANASAVIKIQNNGVMIDPEIDLDYFYKTDQRWNSEIFPEFIRLLNKFYRDSKFRNFFNAHKEFYVKAERNMEFTDIVRDWDWFESFFGESFENPYIIANMTNGRSNYGTETKTISGQKTNYAVVGCNDLNSRNEPIFDVDETNIVHEFIHALVNPLVDKYMNQLAPLSQKIYPYVAKQLEKSGYKWQIDTIMMYETFTRLATQMHPGLYASKSRQYGIPEDEMAGFIWMQAMVDFYESIPLTAGYFLNYKFKDNMPQLVGFMKHVAENIEQYVADYNERRPFVKYIYPANNSRVDVVPGFAIIIKFSQPMRKDLKGIGSNSNDTTAISVASEACCKYFIDDYTFSVPLKLKKGEKYSLVLPKSWFESSTSYKLRDDYTFTFYTNE